MFGWKFITLLVWVGLVSAFPDIKKNIAHFNKVDVNAYRLPVTLIPERYDIYLNVSIENFSFNGEVTITGKALQPTKTIVLHSNNLSITGIEVNTTKGDIPNNHTLSTNDTHFLTINLESMILANQISTVKITYHGKMNDEHHGFYKAKYIDNGTDVWLGTTQFESTSAREAFPCFDEPDLKAVFNIQIERSVNLTSVSNSPPKSKVAKETTVVDMYEDTVKMSTYLIAFVVSDYDSVVNGSHDVYARKAYISDKRGEFALNISVPILQAMADLTDVVYKMPKISQIAIPDRFYAAGAMENWGLVTYKDRYLMYKEGLSTTSEKQRIVAIIAHEYGHQWFGNLVSPKWWTYIWLNEGFATYFETFAAHKVFPGMRLDEQFVINDLQDALSRDVPPETRPITYEAASPAQIDALFDVIAYSKAGSVIRMMEHFLTTEVFMRGLNLYLTEMELKGAVEDDLWRNIQIALKPGSLPATVDTIMKSWTSQSGYPVVTLNKNSDETINITQHVFGAENDSVWYIPINYVTAKDDLPLAFNDTTPSYWLTKESDILPNVNISENSWIILNKHVTGYYRVDYGNMWGDLIGFLKISENIEKIPPTNRAQILDDAFKLAKIGSITYDVLFDLLEYVANETDYIPLYSFYVGISDLLKYAPGLEKQDLVKKMVQEVLGAVYEKLGTEVKEDDQHVDRLNRINILKLMCNQGHDGCRTKMNETFNKGTVLPDIQAPVYCGAMLKDAVANMDKLKTLYSQVEDLEKSRIVAGMGCSQDSNILMSILNNEINLNEEDIPAIRNAIYENELGISTTLTWLDTPSPNLDNEEKLKILVPLSRRIVKEEDKTKVAAIISQLGESADAALVKSINANIEANQKWLVQNKQSINTWLANKYESKNPDDGAASISINVVLSLITLVVIKLQM